MENKLPVKLEGIGKLTEPITKLIEVLSSGIGKLYEPTHKVKMAKAEMKSSIINELSNVITDEIQLRGINVFLEQVTKKQLNFEKIVNKTIKYLPQKLTSEKLPDDGWMMDFFDLCQNCTDNEIQELWAKILADEVDNPNTHSRRLMHNLKILSPVEAKFFKMFAECQCVVHARLNDSNKEIYNNEVISNKGVIVAVNDEIVIGKHTNTDFDYHKLLHLTHVGFFDRVSFFISEDNDFIADEIQFGENRYKLKDAELEVFEFTSLGTELLEIAHIKKDEEYESFITGYLKENEMLR